MENIYVIFFILLILFFCIIFYFLLCTRFIEPLNYGLIYNRVTKKISNKVYENGIYMLSPFEIFLIYPANLVTIEFSDKINSPLNTRTAEGLSLTLSVSFQYKLMKDKIHKLYNLANVNFNSVFERISRDVILKVGGMFNANDYWKNRYKISEKMLNELNKELNKAYASCENLQFLNIELPESFENSIVITQVEVQKINMRKFEQAAELIRQNISVLISEAEQKIKITNSTGIAEAYKIKKNAESQIVNNTIKVEREVVNKIKNDLKMDNKEVLQYLYLNRVDQQNNKKLIVGFGENNNNLILNVNDNK